MKPQVVWLIRVLHGIGHEIVMFYKVIWAYVHLDVRCHLSVNSVMCVVCEQLLLA